MTTIRKTWAEFLEGGLRTLWPGMDDDQKLSLVRYVKKHLGDTTADGVRITWDRVGRAVGSTGDALQGYYRRSQAPSAVSSTALPVEVRRAKSDLLKPGVAERVLRDPQVAAAVQKASLQAMGATHTQAPVSAERREVDAFDYMLRLQSAATALMKHLPDYAPSNKGLREEAETAADHAEVAADFLRAWAKGQDIADEVEAFLGGQA